MALAVDIGELQLGGRYNGSSMWAMRNNNQVLFSRSHGDGGRRWDAFAGRI
jgi:hypothetical protein